ncbi:MAG TPA: DUF4097 family beta strand repeat-containing protein [Bryobacteraceae bacterium]|nr:DUF4097 family beta strand repeat-containing protein [Bryobacteraceae bacterium]
MKLAIAFAAAASLAYGVDSQETIRRTLPAATRLELNNVSGRIHVTGYNGNQIEMTADKTINAESQERLEAAKREVTLDISQSGGELRIYVDGPFRHREGWHRGYDVNYDFELKVPASTALRLSTLNHGAVRVENTSADFDLSNVNGRIELVEAAGAGTAHTVNGDISASFAKNPAANSSFKTVNGAIEASFRPNLSADLRVKTLNGAAYTDFDATLLPRPAAAAGDRHGGRFVYRADKSTFMRVGSGGPEITFETLNGEIRIVKRGQ